MRLQQANLKPNSSKKTANPATNETQKIREDLFFLKRRIRKALAAAEKEPKGGRKSKKTRSIKGASSTPMA